MNATNNPPSTPRGLLNAPANAAQSASESESSGFLSFQERFAMEKTKAAETFQQVTARLQGDDLCISSRRMVFKAVGAQPLRSCGVLIQQKQRKVTEPTMDMGASGLRKQLIRHVKVAIAYCEELESKFKTGFMKGSSANYKPVSAALKHLLNALRERIGKDDDDHAFVVAQCLVRLAVATDMLDNAMCESAFPQRIEPRTGRDFLNGKEDAWRPGDKKKAIDSRIFDKTPQSDKTLGDLSHMLRPSIFFEIARYAGGEKLVRTILDKDGSMVGSRNCLSTKPDIMAVQILESTDSAPGQVPSKDVKEIFMSLMNSNSQPRESAFVLENLSPREFSQRCEQAIEKIKAMESLAGGEAKDRGEAGLSPFQNIVILLANMPEMARKEALHTLGKKYHHRMPDAFVTSGIADLAKTCIKSLEEEPPQVVLIPTAGSNISESDPG